MQVFAPGGGGAEVEKEKEKVLEVGLKAAEATIAPPVRRVWMKGGWMQEVFVREVMKG